MVKLKEIADKANVNVSTVSKALNNSTELNSETANRICRIAKELGYVNKSKKKKRHVVGVIMPEANSIYYTTVAHGLKVELASRGYQALFAFTGIEDLSSVNTVQLMLQNEVDGIIIDSDAFNKGTTWVWSVSCCNPIPRFQSRNDGQCYGQLGAIIANCSRLLY